MSTSKTIVRLAKRVARAVAKEGLSYEDWRRMNKLVRKFAKLKSGKRGNRLPKILTDDELARFWAAVDAAGNAQHGLMLRILYFTGCRIAELISMKKRDVDLGGLRIRIIGKGDKERTVLFPEALQLPLRLHMDGLEGDRLWVGRQGAVTDRRVRQIVAQYARAAAVKASPHTFRHAALTKLTRAGMTDTQIQVISGHARRETLAIYQHLVTDDVAKGYAAAMK